MSFDDFNLKEHGYTVHDFLEQTVIDDRCAYSHYFTSGVMGRPVIQCNDDAQQEAT